MTALLPNRFLFDFEFPLHYRAVFPEVNGDVSDFTDDDLLPRLGELDGASEFADVWACWNEGGLFVACRVTGKRKPLRCRPSTYWTGDNLRLCTDMRDTRTIKRATRYCQQFYFLPTGGGRRGSEPACGAVKIKRASADAPCGTTFQPVENRSHRLRVAARVSRTGYTLTAHIPAACLSGFDPDEHPRIGFYYILEDSELGQQYLTVGDDLYWYVDPSTWATAVLERSK